MAAICALLILAAWAQDQTYRQRQALRQEIESIQREDAELRAKQGVNTRLP
jgi:hypothetical protein